MKETIIRVTKAMLTDCPAKRMVARVDPAMPKCCLSTELIMALLLGEAKRAKLAPKKANLAAMSQIGVVGSIKMSDPNPKVVSPMPQADTVWGDILSERAPAKGDKSVISTGWESMINPAVCELKPITVCR